MARSYAVHLRLSGSRVLVVGAGRVAQRRLSRLLPTEAELHVVAPTASDAVRAWAGEGRLHWSERRFEPRDCQAARLVYAATDDGALNALVEASARACGALVNRADAPDRCDFWVPAVAETETCTASLSTGGRAPGAARRLSQELGRFLEAGADRFVQTVEHARTQLLERADAQASTRLRTLAEGPLYEACREGDEAAVQRLLNAALATEAPGG